MRCCIRRDGFIVGIGPQLLCSCVDCALISSVPSCRCRRYCYGWCCWCCNVSGRCRNVCWNFHKHAVPGVVYLAMKHPTRLQGRQVQAGALLRHLLLLQGRTRLSKAELPEFIPPTASKPRGGRTSADGLIMMAWLCMRAHMCLTTGSFYRVEGADYLNIDVS